jgi:oligopeptide/dipeptide ABC transporter ATP-binding protein
MIFQQPGNALDPGFTLGQQISAVYRRHKGGSKQGIRQSMLESLQAAGFKQAEDIAASYPHQLSGGMQQLAMIAMATVCKPAVLIADEPSTALDGMSRMLILQQLKRLQMENQTAILLISHDLNVVRHSCNDVIVMYCGRLMEKSACQQLFAHPRHPYSAGMLSCIPQISPSRPPGIKAIPGQVPTTDHLPPGCHFAPRCDRSEAQCKQSVPPFESPQGDSGRGELGSVEPDNDSRVACFRPLS